MVKSSANLKNVGVVSGFIKKPNGFPAILSFVRISQNCFYIEKSHGSSLWITGSRLPLSPWWTRDHRAARPLQAREVIVIYSLKRERERTLLGFSPMVPHGGRAAEMVTQGCSTEAADCAPIGR
jgi:hypothetical protein